MQKNEAICRGIAATEIIAKGGSMAGSECLQMNRIGNCIDTDTAMWFLRQQTPPSPASFWGVLTQLTFFIAWWHR